MIKDNPTNDIINTQDMTREEILQKIHEYMSTPEFQEQEKIRQVKNRERILRNRAIFLQNRMKMMRREYLTHTKLKKLQELEHKELLTPAEVELRYSIKERTQKKYREENLIPYIQPKNPHGFRKKGYNVLYSRTKLDQWALENEIEIKKK